MTLLLSSPSLGTTAHASSTLNNNSRLYGASNALDNKNESSCWNSDGQAEGDTEHSFIVNFHRNVRISSLGLQFQGGFVAEECRLYATKTKETLNSSEGWVEIKDAFIEPENTNTLQVFSLDDCKIVDDLNCVAIKLVFDANTDFYGRIILYKIEVYGEEV
jgi:F5/8 type C domain.